MGLIVPIVGVDPGPDWANNINASLGILDQHNHSTGQGVPITPTGLNINVDLPINGNNLNLVKTVNFKAQASSLPGSAPNLGCVYVAGSELYYNDEVGNVVKITTSGSVNAGAGSITGLPSGTASASFSAGTFVWQSATNTPANTDTGSVILRNIVANSKGLTLSPPNSMAANYNVTLPSLPGVQSLLTLDTSGNMGTTMTTAMADSVGLAMDAVGANAVGNAINSSATANSISNLRSKSVATTNPGVGGVLASALISGTFSGATNQTILNFSLTTSGRPVEVFLQPFPNNTSSYFTCNSNGTNIFLVNNTSGTVLENETSFPTAGQLIPLSSFSWCDTSSNGSPGTISFTLGYQGNNSLSSCQFVNAQLIAYEL